MYLIISAISLALMVAVYRLTLSRTTFHGFNRYVLLSSLALAAILPLIHFQGIGNKAVAPVAYLLNEITVFAEGEVSLGDAMVETGSHISAASILTLVYLAGLVICLLRVAVGILSSEFLCHKRSRMLSDGSRLVITERNYAPFSWRNYIVVSRKDYESDGSMIIAHEQAHIRHHHSIDLILAQIFCSVQWFNPAAWMLKRSLLEVHEFEADASVLEHGFDERRYQICLVRAALQGSFATTTNNFSSCSTKKRIIMMKRHSTKPWARLRVLLMLPAAAVAIVMSSASKPDAYINVSETSTSDKSSTKAVVGKNEGLKADTSAVVMEIEEAPEFPGGAAAMFEYLRSNTHYPRECRENKVQGRVMITFIVEKDGSLTDVEIVNGVDPLLDAEALRVVSSMPKWIPGRHSGETVRVRYAIPINFRLN